MIDIKLENLKRARILLTEDMGAFLRKLDGGEYAEEREYLERVFIKEEKITVIGIVNPQKDKDILYDRIMSNMIMKNCGVFLGGGAAAQRFLNFSDLGYSEGNLKLPPGLGYLKTAETDKTILVKMPINRKEEDDDFD